MKKITIFLFLIFCLSSQAKSLTLEAPSYSPVWADVWTNASYNLTNGESQDFRAGILRSQGKFGVRLAENSPASPYVAYYLTLSQNNNYWNNNIAGGFGVRAMPFSSYEYKGWAIEWIKDIKLYAEVLSMAFLTGRATAEANKVKNTDFLYGIDIWHEWNLRNIDPNVCWAEMWSNISYRDTNFYDPTSLDKFQSYVAFMQLKIGRYFTGGIMPYLASYLNISGVKKVYLNNESFGIGIRMEPFLNQETAPELLRKFKMFVEAISISYIAEQDPTRPTSDTRFGFEFTYGR